MYDRLVLLMRKWPYTEEEICSVPLLLEDLKHRRVQNVGRLETKLRQCASDVEQWRDILEEGKAALVLASNGFEVTLYPCGQKGVDFGAAWQHYHLFVEFARFRDDRETRRKLAEGEEIQICGEKIKGLVSYGKGANDVKAVYDKIVSEANQLPENEMGLVFLRTDNVRIEDVEFEEAGEYLSALVLEDGPHARLSGVLFDSRWYKLPTGKRVYLWRNPKAERLIDDALFEKLTMLREPPSHDRKELEEIRSRFPIA